MTTLRERYQLVERERMSASIEAKGWWGWGARRPLKMALPERNGVDPGLLLFTAYVVRTLADKSGSDAGGATAAASAATNSGAYSG